MGWLFRLTLGNGSTRVWLAKLIATWVLRYLLRLAGVSETVDHMNAVLTKDTPLLPDPNPPRSVRNNPTLSNPPERGGIPR